MAHSPPSTGDLPDPAAELARKAEAALRRVDRAKLKVATAESCTGGLLASLFTDIEGLSSTFERGFVTYSVEAKCDLLGLDPAFVERHGVVSREVAKAMAEGALERSRADIACAVTGFAGKAGPRDEAGLVHLAVLRRGARPILRECHFGDAGRDVVRAQSAEAVIAMVNEALDEG